MSALYGVVIRTLDVLFAAVGLMVCLPLLLLLILIGLIDTGAPLFFQSRVGRGQRPFVLVKLRTMRVGAPQVATHLARADAVTRFGRFLRKSKLDELPQLWNVLRGDMSLVGPRPCLFNQVELIAERQARGVFDVRPGITGLAQIRGVDMSEPKKLAEIDSALIGNLSLQTYLKCIVATVLGNGQGDRIR